MSHFSAYLLLGLLAGVLSGMIGIGGGTIIVPILVFALGFTQHEAQGTTLALTVPPVGILAAWAYYKQGCIHFDAAAYMCAGFLLGGFLGARLATGLSNVVLGRVFGVAMLLVSMKMIFTK